MNRNKLLNLFVSNLSNVIVHKILEKAIDKPEIALSYNKEVRNSMDIAKRYREKINPINKLLPISDAEEVRTSIIRRVKSELNIRIEKGYSNIDISLVELFTDKLLKELEVI